MFYRASHWCERTMLKHRLSSGLFCKAQNTATDTKLINLRPYAGVTIVFLQDPKLDQDRIIFVHV